ncbi:MAG: GxxExxY protein [Planctomycetes bacterium]|nr:GxxExxY protein [Planctomycetota bacterium]
MPIEGPEGIRTISQEEFYEIDYGVMRLIFDIHKELGRLWDEKIYKKELAFRCHRAGHKDVRLEVPIKVSFREFARTYHMDILLDGAAMYELKTASTLTRDHRKQAIQYLLLAGLNHGRLINMRPPAVQYTFVSTRLTSEQRRRYSVEDAAWLDTDSDGEWLKKTMLDLLADWGAFLPAELYQQAIVCLRGGEEVVSQHIEIVEGTRVIATQPAQLLKAMSRTPLK